MVDLNTLNPQQRQAVVTIDGPVLILAGAGTGKTRVITFRMAHMIARGISPQHILGVTFTNKAAREMQERVTKLVPTPRRPAGSDAPPDRPTICTFHSLCVRILRQHIEHLGYKRNFVIFDESDQLSAIKKILSRLHSKGEKQDPAAILALLSKYRNGGARARAFDAPGVAEMAATIQRSYESALRACNAVDFDDLILLALRLFEGYPEVLEACRRKYRYVMVDEYQDTNAAQFRLVHLLTKEHQNLCVVGDDDQSIYGWRGAEIANLLELEKHYPKVKVVKLEQNYRSTNTILTAANAVIKHNPRRRPKQLWSQKGQGSKIILHAFENEEEEAKTVAEQIDFDRVAKRIPWGDQAILFRTNIQARPVETALRQARIRYNLIGGQSYFDRREIRDVLAYLKTFLNPHDDVSLLRIANTPARGLSDVTMERLLASSQEHHCSVYGAMKRPEVRAAMIPKTRAAVEAFTALVDQRREQLASGQGIILSTWSEGFLQSIKYWDELRRSEKTPEAAENRIRNVRELLLTMDTAGSPAAAPAERLEKFLEDLTLDSEREEEKEREAEAVTLITMHSCKGLEFPHVHIVGIEDGLLPHTRSKEEGTLDEERRLFYVALTRAMKTLTLSHCAARKKYGQLVPCHPSPFLAELPRDLVEDADEKSAQPVSVNQGKDYFAAMRAALGPAPKPDKPS